MPEYNSAIEKHKFKPQIPIDLPIDIDAMKIKADFDSVDWSFDNSTRLESRGVHPYPAKFIPEIPREIISILGVPKGTAVLDPFCGSGTSIAEAQRLGLKTIGVDLNPIACLITRVRTGSKMPGLKDIAQEISQKATRRKELWRPQNVPNLEHWFKDSVAQSLANIVKEISVSAGPIFGDALRLALSRIIVRVSNQESDTRYAAIEKPQGNVYRHFVLAAEEIEKYLELRNWIPKPEPNIICHDILDLTAKKIGQQVGLVLTSPPYPNAYEYWLYHKFRLAWLGWDPTAIKRKEIGSRSHFFSSHPHTEFDFLRQMRGLFALLKTITVKDAHAAFVVGDSKIKGKIIDNGILLRMAAKENDFNDVIVYPRSVASNRKAFNTKYSRAKSEEILVFKRR
ncbi:MAG: DNA methyltransferase [Elusimicrobiales bacterium]|nr:DNA methyltransferase [Elusimicrobiales bacterium]